MKIRAIIITILSSTSLFIFGEALSGSSCYYPLHHYQISFMLDIRHSDDTTGLAEGKVKSYSGFEVGYPDIEENPVVLSTDYKKYPNTLKQNYQICTSNFDAQSEIVWEISMGGKKVCQLTLSGFNVPTGSDKAKKGDTIAVRTSILNYNEIPTRINGDLFCSFDFPYVSYYQFDANRLVERIIISDSYCFNSSCI